MPASAAASPRNTIATLKIQPADGNTFPQARYKNPETALGGADAVEKTTYVTGKGTSPEATNAGRPIATVGAGRGLGPLGWIVGALVVLAVLAYALGFLR